VKQNSFLGDKPYELHQSCQYPLSRESAGRTTSTPRSIRCKLLLIGHLRAKDGAEKSKLIGQSFESRL
jgi:hypothetical protein